MPPPAHDRTELSYRPPFDWPGLTSFLGSRAHRGVEELADGRYRRLVASGGESGVIEVENRPAESRLVVTFESRLAGLLPEITARLRRLFDLDADPDRIDAELARSDRLRPLVKARPGLRVPGSWDPFEMSIRVILGQQISVAGATTLANRLVERFGERVAELENETLQWRYPEPARLTDPEIRSIGLTAARTKTINRFAGEVAEGRLQLGKKRGLEETVSTLTALPGIGPWTAHVIAMRALGQPDAFPHGDLGIVKALSRSRTDRASEKEILAIAESFRPYRAYAAMHLWRNEG